jgi:hypothetical protein
MTREARETRASSGKAWGLHVHEQQSKTNHHLLHSRTSILWRRLGGYACLAIAMRQASDGFALRHMDFAIGEMATTMLCMCEV